MSSLRRFLGHNRWAVGATLFPLVADAVHWVYFEPLNAALRGVLATPGVFAVGLLSGLYLVWLVSLVFVGHLQPEVNLKAVTFEIRNAPDPAGRPGRTTRNTTTWPKILFFYPSLLFGLMWLMLIIQATGMSLEAPAVSEGVQNAALMAAVGLFIAHCIVAAVDVSPRHASGTPGHLAVLVPVVLVGELVLNLSTAAWLQLFSADAGDATEVAEAATRSGGELFGAVLLFLLLFAGPRFTFLSRHFTPVSLLSGLAFVVWEVWETLDRIAF